MPRSFPLAALSLAALLCFTGLARAADDHGHDHGPAPAAAGPALPRFAATSELFELVGVLQGTQVTLYLDRAADNAPVSDAQIELEIGGVKLKAQKHGADAFEVVLPAAPQPGVLPVTATVSVGQEMDLLAGELDIHEAAHAEAGTVGGSGWKTYATWAAAGLAGLALLGLLGRRLLGARQPRFGSAA